MSTYFKWTLFKSGRVGNAGKSAEVSEVPGQEFADAGDGLVCDTLQDVPEIEFRIEAVEPG